MVKLSLRSKITIKLLGYFFLNPHRRHYVNELARMFRLDPKNLYRKLRELEDAGILKSDFQGSERYFSLNLKFPLLKEYRAIFLKTIGLEEKLRQILSDIHGVKHAYLFGSYARDRLDASSDIDLLVIGEHLPPALQKKVSALQKEIGREINIINLSSREFAKKKKVKDPFLRDIFSGKYIALI